MGKANRNNMKLWIIANAGKNKSFARSASDLRTRLKCNATISKRNEEKKKRTRVKATNENVIKLKLVFIFA